MAKIAYPNKQTAVNPASPAANEIFTAANANEIKTVVNGLDDLVTEHIGIVDNATADYTSTTVNAAYPSVSIGQEVICPYMTSGPVIWKKVTSSVWYEIQMGKIQYYLIQTTPYYSALSGGSITILAFNTDYPTLSANGIVRMSGYITVNGTEVEVDLTPVVTRVSGNITAATFNFGIDGTITTFKLRMY